MGGGHTVSVGMDTSTGPGTGLREPRRGRRGWRLGLLGLALAFVVLAAYDLTSVGGRLGSGTQAQPAAATPRPAPTDSASPSVAAPPTEAQGPAPQPLSTASVTAFGPGGPSDGDHPGAAAQLARAGQALSGDGAAKGTTPPWSTSWYATPDFGNLQSGTGLLLDLGHPVTVSSVRLLLGSARGADVQVRVGNDPTLAGLSTAASAAGVGGRVQVRVPADFGPTGRYVLIWFTRLPPDGQGHYQVDVYGVTVNGTPLLAVR